jgi:hypothetical protein
MSRIFFGSVLSGGDSRRSSKVRGAENRIVANFFRNSDIIKAGEADTRQLFPGRFEIVMVGTVKPRENRGRIVVRITRARRLFTASTGRKLAAQQGHQRSSDGES